MSSAQGAERVAVVTPLAGTKRARRPLPGWKAVLVREDTYTRLQEIRQTTVDPHFDLHDLTEAAIRVGMEFGAEAIVKRARAERKRRSPS